MPFPEFDALAAHRRWLDAIIERWIATPDDDDLRHVLRYTNTRGNSFARELVPVLLHFFNHQAHHRGQTSTLLSQPGVDVVVTDLVAMIPDAGADTAAAPPPQGGDRRGTTHHACLPTARRTSRHPPPGQPPVALMQRQVTAGARPRTDARVG